MASGPDLARRRRKWLAAAAILSFIGGCTAAAKLPTPAVLAEALAHYSTAGSSGNGSAGMPDAISRSQPGTSRDIGPRPPSAPFMSSSQHGGSTPTTTPFSPVAQTPPSQTSAPQTPGPQTPTPQPTASPSSTAPQPDGIPGTWSLTLNDGPADLAHWGGWFGKGITGPVNSAEDACYSQANATVSGGYMNMALTDQSAKCHGKSEPYTGSLLSSFGKFDQTYGAFEARIDVPATSGGAIADWPAFWLDGRGTWPVTGEIDVLEGLSGDACYHFHYEHNGVPAGPGGCTSTGPGWHTFAAVWEPGSITYYYDGAKVGVITSGVTSKPMYLILDLTDSPQVGGSRVIPATMRVAYVRAWSGSA